MIQIIQYKSTNCFPFVLLMGSIHHVESYYLAHARLVFGWLENLQQGDYLEDLGVEGRII
jgi:hypothetical protein